MAQGLSKKSSHTDCDKGVSSTVVTRTMYVETVKGQDSGVVTMTHFFQMGTVALSVAGWKWLIVKLVRTFLQ